MAPDRPASTADNSPVMRPLGWVLGGFGLLLGALAAIAWHWQPTFGWFAYLPADADPGGFLPLSGFRHVVWQVAVGFPVAGAALGVVAAGWLGRRLELVPRHQESR